LLSQSRNYRKPIKDYHTLTAFYKNICKLVNRSRLNHLSITAEKQCSKPININHILWDSNKLWCKFLENDYFVNKSTFCKECCLLKLMALNCRRIDIVNSVAAKISIVSNLLRQRKRMLLLRKTRLDSLKRLVSPYLNENAQPLRKSGWNGRKTINKQKWLTASDKKDRKRSKTDRTELKWRKSWQ
jgi:hypothetical protein